SEDGEGWTHWCGVCFRTRLASHTEGGGPWSRWPLPLPRGRARPGDGHMDVVHTLVRSGWRTLRALPALHGCGPAPALLMRLGRRLPYAGIEGGELGRRGRERGPRLRAWAPGDGDLGGDDGRGDAGAGVGAGRGR